MKSDDILWSMPPITLSVMDSISLMDRIDTKYLSDVGTVWGILGRLSDLGYYIFENDSQRVTEYRSMYYDTSSLQMYLDHHNRRLVRQKLRIRRYMGAGETFLELKSKNNHGRTKKKRIRIEPSLYLQDRLSDEEQLRWLDGRIDYPAEELSPSLETIFRRITVVNPSMTERSTIDLDLTFRNVRTGLDASLGPLVIIEVKQDGSVHSPLRDILLEMRVKPFRISKYCIGTALTSPQVKSCRFKPKIMTIDKMKQQYDNSSSI